MIRRILLRQRKSQKSWRGEVEKKLNAKMIEKSHCLTLFSNLKVKIEYPITLLLSNSLLRVEKVYFFHMIFFLLADEEC